MAQNFLFIKQTDSPTIGVLVHGLRGDVRKSWERLITLFSEDKEFTADLACWGYPTKVLGRVPSVWQAAEQLQTELRVRLEHYGKIVLIGHSLGGLVIRAFVISALRAGRVEDCERIAHIVALATPNDGNEMASIFKFLGRQVADLDIKGETVTELRNEWINRVYAPKILTGEERYKYEIPLTTVVGLEDSLVTPQSVKSFFQNPPPETVPGDHTSMKDPASTDETIYQLLKKIILSTINVRPKGAPEGRIESIHILESDELGFGLEALVDNTGSKKPLWSERITLGGRMALVQLGYQPFLNKAVFEVTMDCCIKEGSGILEGRVKTARGDEWDHQLEGLFVHTNGTPEKSWDFNLSFPAFLKFQEGEKVLLRLIFKPALKKLVKHEQEGQFIASFVGDIVEKRFWMEIATNAGILRHEIEDDSFLEYLANQGEVTGENGL